MTTPTSSGSTARETCSKPGPSRDATSHEAFGLGLVDPETTDCTNVDLMRRLVSEMGVIAVF